MKKCHLSPLKVDTFRYSVVSDCVIENITSVLQCLNKVEESLKCSLKMQKKLFLHKEGDYCKYFSIIFTFSIMFKNVPVL